jgi:ketosteroid isomerase-like protein
MSANLDFVRSLYPAWERGDFSRTDWADPQIEYVHADGPDPGSWQGLTGMAKGFRSVLGAWQDVRIEADAYRQLDEEHVLVLVKRRARGKLSGIEIAGGQTDGAHLLRIQDGKVVKLANYFDRDRALADLGLAAEGDDS